MKVVDWVMVQLNRLRMWCERSVHQPRHGGVATEVSPSRPTPEKTRASVKNHRAPRQMTGDRNRLGLVWRRRRTNA